jgi:hypothetical protein
MNNKFTFFYFLEYNLFNQPTQKSLYGDLSITGLVGFNHKELNPNACPLARKKNGSSFTAAFSDNFAMRGYGLIT